MYKMTARMMQHFEADLKQYHTLFDGDRCSGWELEELIVRAIRSDTTAQHQPRWKEAGHDDKADILVRTNGEEHPIQIKSGTIQKNRLVISGHRLGKFEGDLREISAYLNRATAHILAIPYQQTNDDLGRHHQYRICSVPVWVLHQVNKDGWEKKGKQYIQISKEGIEYSLRPSMSWQIWWKIPIELITVEKTLHIT